MTDNMIELYKEFLKIREKGYVKETIKGFLSPGDTFETLLGKKRDKLPFSDYKGIEIKTKRGYYDDEMTLFIIEPYDLYNFVNKYGYTLKNDTKKKFYLLATSKVTHYVKHNFVVIVDYELKEVRIDVYDWKEDFVETGVSWSFETIKNRLILKLNTLAFIKFCKERKDDEYYYYYYSLTYYKNVMFENFLKEIENGHILIQFIATIDNTGKKNSHGTSFRIKPKYLKNIYEEKISPYPYYR